MAHYTAKYLRWAPKTAAGVAGTSFPTYGAVLNMGPLASVGETINTVRAENHGDGELQEFVDEFVSVALACSVTEMPIDTAVAIYGATKNASGGISFNLKDAPPEGVLGLITGKQFKNEEGLQQKAYQGVVYPNVKGSRQGTTYNTKGSSIAFANANANFTGTAEENGYHCVMSGNLATEAEATAWVDKMLKGGEEALAAAQAAEAAQAAQEGQQTN